MCVVFVCVCVCVCVWEGGARGQQLERRKVWRGERGMNVGRICDEGEGMMCTINLPCSESLSPMCDSSTNLVYHLENFEW